MWVKDAVEENVPTLEISYSVNGLFHLNTNATPALIVKESGPTLIVERMDSVQTSQEKKKSNKK